MTKDELISEIRKQKQKLSDVYLDGTPYGLETRGNNILKLLRQLVKAAENGEDSEKNEIISYKEALNDLSHTIDKEVQYAINAYSESRKKNTAMKRKTEYDEELDNALSQMNRDLSFI